VVDLQEAYASCERLARAHYENFPVASALLPRAMRPHVAAVYAFARVADDFADEGERTAAERIELLGRWRDRLHRSLSGGEGPLAGAGEPAQTAQIFRAVGATIRSRQLPVALFDDLLSAFEQDVRVTRYATWNDLLDYCRRSANPVGRLVLGIAGYRDPRLLAQSDAICTALQLTNFWQDLKIDYGRGRIYLPAEELRTSGAREEDLGRSPLTAESRRALAAAVERTRKLFDCGRPLCDQVRGRLRYELRATWLGGTRILQKLEAAGFEPAANRVKLGAADAPWFLWNLAAWHR
jgi:hydroxysqualene synthase